ncbi:MAG: Bifunctional protein FolD protein [Elusimicrobia bacterium ADurb.Bin231]|nr:MAG: Bifunctional protein FolD protein [Elusimicrobia bacterium ADurb.Bin231]
MNIINGKKIADEIKNKIKLEIHQISQKHTAKKPCLTVIQSGEDKASNVYIKNQKNCCEEVGIDYRLLKLNGDAAEKEFIETVRQCGDDKSITGIIVHLPLPKHINAQTVQSSINPYKDVEGITPHNLGMLFYHDVPHYIVPCTARAVLECLNSTGQSIKGKETVIVGHSEIVGKSLCLMMLSSSKESATPTVCHIATKNLADHTRRADILVVAVGKPEFIRGDMVKEGAIVIDVGINVKKVLDTCSCQTPDALKPGAEKFITVGDVCFNEVAQKAGYITPVPGGVGPVTSAMLLNNLLMLYKMQQK